MAAVEQNSVFGQSLSWRRNAGVLGSPLRSGSQTYGWGFGVHATSHLSFDLPAGANRFTAGVGLDAAAGDGGCAGARVELAGRDSAEAQKLYESPPLIGSAKVETIGPLALAGGDQPRRLILHADAAPAGRPAGGEPLDIRDHVNWLEPMIAFDPTWLRGQIHDHAGEAFAAWDGWEISTAKGDAAAGLPVAVQWEQPGESMPRFNLRGTGAAGEITLTSRKKLRRSDRWLRLHVARETAAPGGEVEIRAGGETLVRWAIPLRGYDRPLLVPLAERPGEEVELQVVYTPGDAAQRIWWGGLNVTGELRDDGWRALKITSATSQRGARLVVEPDGETAVEGKSFDVDTYQLVVHSDLPSIAAIRLEAIADPKLQGGGPGATAGGNFRIGRFRAALPAAPGKPITGRFVRIELPGEKRTLHLAEVQLFDGETNVALGGAARQSSTDSDGAAAKAIDGNIDGYFSAGSCTHTKADSADPWWEVDLGEEKSFDRIVIWNRVDNGCVHRLSGFDVVVLDEDRNTVWARREIADPPSPAVTLRRSEQEQIPIAAVAAGYAQNGTSPSESLRAGLSGWSIAPRTGQSHAAEFELARPLNARLVGGQRRFEIEMKNSRFGLGLPARFRLWAAASPSPGPVDAVPMVVRIFPSAQTPSRRDLRTLPPLYALLDEEVDAKRNGAVGFVPLAAGEERAAFTAEDKLTGKQSLKLPAGGQHRLLLPQVVRIRRSPKEGELRYLRFAVRVKGDGRVSLALEQPVETREVLRYDAGRGAACYGPAFRDWHGGLPDAWVMMQHDLYAEWGEVDICGLTLGTPDGEPALVDCVYLAKSLSDFSNAKFMPPLSENNRLARKSLAAPIEQQVQQSVVGVVVGEARATGVLIGDGRFVLTKGSLLPKAGGDVDVYLADGRRLKATAAGVWRDQDCGAVKLVDRLTDVKGVEFAADVEMPPNDLYIGFDALTYAPAAKPNIQSYLTNTASPTDETFESTFAMGGGLEGGPLFDRQSRLIGIRTSGKRFARGAALSKQWKRMTAGETWGKWPDSPK